MWDAPPGGAELSKGVLVAVATEVGSMSGTWSGADSLSAPEEENRTPRRSNRGAWRGNQYRRAPYPYLYPGRPPLSCTRLLASQAAAYVPAVRWPPITSGLPPLP